MAGHVRKQTKGRNGVGDSVTVFFDPSDPAERRALEAARLLATKHGRRKSAIVALLEAVYVHYETTGELMSSAEITSALHNRAGEAHKSVTVPSGVPQVSAMEYIAEEPYQRKPSSPMRSAKKPQRQQTNNIEIVHDGKASAQKVADNFLSSMKNLSLDFFD